MDGSGVDREYREGSQFIVRLEVAKMVNSITAHNFIFAAGLDLDSHATVWDIMNESGTRMLTVTEVMLFNDEWRAREMDHGS